MPSLDRPSIDDLLANATDLPAERTDYVNSLRVSTALNEMTIDFYRILPSTKRPENPPDITHVQRILIPLGVAKNFAEILSASVEGWEAKFGVMEPIDDEDDIEEIDSEE